MGSTADKVKGATNEAIGKAKQGVGEAVGSDRLQGEGVIQETKGKGQQALGDAKYAVKYAANKIAGSANKNLLSLDHPTARIPPGMRAVCLFSICYQTTQAAGCPAACERLDQLAALRLTPLRSATVFNLVLAAFSSLRLVVRKRTMSSCPSSSAHAISVP
jgi:uncharacterized protein YjbJ (UPF0337 family)